MALISTNIYLSSTLKRYLQALEDSWCILYLFYNVLNSTSRFLPRISVVTQILGFEYPPGIKWEDLSQAIVQVRTRASRSRLIHLLV
jgi:hypothetical protein